MEELAGVLVDVACGSGGALQRVVSRSLVPRERELEEGRGVDAVFPVPLVRRGRLPLRGRKRVRAKKRLQQLGLVNALLASWNLQFLGPRSSEHQCTCCIGCPAAGTSVCQYVRQ